MVEPISNMLFQMVLKELSLGRSLLRICQEMGIDRNQIYRFRDETEQRQKDYLKARQDGYDAMADECQEIADDARRDTKQGKFGPVMDAEYVARSKLRIETRLKLLACYDPKRFGTKVEISTDGDKPPLTMHDLYAAHNAAKQKAPIDQGETLQ